MPKLIPLPEAPNLKHLGRRENSPIIWCRKTITGLGQRFFSTGESDVKRAIRAAQEIEKRLIEDAKAPDHTRFAHFAEIVFRSMLPHWRVNTQKSAENHFFNILVPYFGGYPIKEITDELWGVFIAEVLSLSPTRDLRNTQKYMRMILRKARNSGLTNKTMELRIPPRPPSPGKWFSDEEVEAILRKARPRLVVQILMAFLMGMRKWEILALEWERVDLELGTLRLGPEHTKTKKPREIAIHPTVLEFLKELEEKTDSSWVFPMKDGQEGHQKSTQGDWEDAKHAARVEGRFHDLRHSFLCNTLLKNRENPLHVSIYAGVSLEELQHTYLHPDAETTRAIASSIQFRLPFTVSLGRAE